MIQQQYVEQLVLWSHKTCLRGHPFLCCTVATRPQVAKRRGGCKRSALARAPISQDDGEVWWWTCNSFKTKLTKEIIWSDFFGFNTFPVNPFKGFLTCYQNKHKKRSPYLRMQCYYDLADARFRERSQHIERFFPSHLEIFSPAWSECWSQCWFASFFSVQTSHSLRGRNWKCSWKNPKEPILGKEGGEERYSRR